MAESILKLLASFHSLDRDHQYRSSSEEMTSTQEGWRCWNTGMRLEHQLFFAD